MKKIVFLVLTLLLLAALCLGIGFSAMAADTDGVNALELSIREGYALPEIPADAKPVGSYSEFMGMAVDGVYYLMADFEMSMSYLVEFKGTLYGNGHTITIKGDPVFTTLEGATVRDLTIVGTATSVSGAFDNVGGLARQSYDTTLIGITNKADVTQEWTEYFAGGVVGYAENTTFKYCTNYGTVKASRPGGIMGQCNNAQAYIVLENCINHGTVNGVNQTGGLVSRVEACDFITITDSANFGTVNVSWSDSSAIIGKIINNNAATFRRVYNSGTVSAGTICGSMAGYCISKNLIMDDCHNGCFVDSCSGVDCAHGQLKQVRAGGDFGSLIGSAYSNTEGYTITITNCTNTADVITTHSSRTGGLFGVLAAENVTLRDCVNYGNVGSASYSGGIVARIDSVDTFLIENVTNHGDVTVTASYGGGIWGYNQYGKVLRLIGVTNNGTVTTTWNAGGLGGRIDGDKEAADEISFINCTNNGDVSGSDTAGGIMGILEAGRDVVAKLSYTNCVNTGNMIAPNNAGGIAGISIAKSVQFVNCRNSGSMNFLTRGEGIYAGGIAGRVYGTMTFTDCVNSGNVVETATVKEDGTGSAIHAGGIIGWAGQGGTDYKADTATYTRCVNTGTIVSKNALRDSQAVLVGGIVGVNRSTCTAYYCVNMGDVNSTRQAGGIAGLAAQNEQGGTNFTGCVVTGNIYNNGKQVTDRTHGSAGIACYVWGAVQVYKCTVTGDVQLDVSGSSLAKDQRRVCTALVGYTNNPDGKFQYNYFSGSLIAGEGTDCIVVMLAYTVNHNVAGKEGSNINYNYSVNEYPLHYHSAGEYSASKTTLIAPADMAANTSAQMGVVKTCDGTELPINSYVRSAYQTALDLKGHNYSSEYTSTDHEKHCTVCACGTVSYAKHEYENACDADCGICGYVREVGDHVGEFACSDICAFCGIAIEAAAHTTSADCDTTCNVCGETVEATAEHNLDKPCDTICPDCGETVETAHKGAFDCSTTCQWCGTVIKAVAAHKGEFDCSGSCAACGALVHSVGHMGASACATVCIYCDKAIQPSTEHEKEYECSTACKNCGEAMEGGCVGVALCATYCAYCGKAIVPTEYHAVDPEKPCVATCTACGEAVAAAPHSYAYDCSVTCSICGAVRSGVDHAYSYACDADCNYCGELRTAAAHNGGAELCADVCVWCGISIEPAQLCTGLLACSETCQWCGEAVTGVDHTYHHNCDVDCNVCGDVRKVGPHIGLYPCSTNCQYCNMSIPASGSHVYDNRCDLDCNNCGTIRLAGHTYDNACDAACNVCNEVRTPADHVYKNDCDVDCEVCKAERTAEGGLKEHVYDNPCNDIDCNVCGVMRSELSDHTYDGCLDGDCNVCKATRNVDNAAHNYEGVEWVIVTPATKDTDGQQERACAVCGAKVTEVIPKGTKMPGQDDTILGMEPTVFYIVVAAVAAAVVIAVVVAVVVTSKKKKAKKAAAEAEEAPVAEQAAEETAEDDIGAPEVEEAPETTEGDKE